MLNRNLRVLLLAGLVLVAAGQRDGTRRVSERSEDGTQAGEVVLSEDGSSGSVSASSVGTRRAGSSVSLTVTGDSATTRGGFVTQGDSQGVSGRLPAAERRSRREGREGRGRGNGNGGGRRPESDEPVPSMLGGSSGGGSGASASSSSTVTSVASSSSSESTTEGETSSKGDASSRSATTEMEEEEEEEEEVMEETGDADEAEEVIETSKPTETSEDDSSEEVAQSSDPVDTDEEAPQQSTTVASSSSVSISGEDAGVSTSVSRDSSSGDKKKICVRTQSEFEQKLREGYEVTLVRKVSGGNVEVLREYKGPRSHSRSRIISSIIPEQIKEECNITEATLGIKKRTDGSFTSTSSTTTSSSSSSSTSGSFSSGQSSGSTSRSPRQQGIYRLCSKENLKKFTGLKDICDRLMERSQERRSSDVFDIKSEFG